MRTRRSPRNQDILFRSLGNKSQALYEHAADLLRACKAARVELDAMHDHLYPMCDGGCPADAILRQLADVIFRAEGNK